MNGRTREDFLREAVRVASENVASGGGPFGAIVVRDGEIVARGANRVTATNDPTAHAEVEAIREACRVLGTFQLEECEIYTSSEPCPMCLGAVYWARPRAVYYANGRAAALSAGFDDHHIYEEFLLPPEQRRYPLARLEIDGADEPFRRWRRRPIGWSTDAMKICDTTDGGRPTGESVRRSRVLALLLVSGLGATALLPSWARGQEPGAVADAPAVVAGLQSDTVPSIAERARAILDTLGMAADSLQTLRATRLTDPGVELDFLRFQALRQVGRMQEELKSLSRLLREASPDSLPTDSVRAVLRGYLLAHLDVLDANFAETANEFDEIRVRRATATAQEIGPLELQIKDLRAWADTVIRYQQWALSEADSFRLDVADRWKRYDQTLLEFAENTVGRLQIAVSERNSLRERIRVAERTNAPATEIADLKLKLGAAQTRIDAIADNAASLNDRLAERGYETAAYRENLIRATGEVTGDVLDPQVLLRLARGYLSDLWRSLRQNAGTIFVRVLIVIAFIVFFRVLFSLLWRFAQAVRLVRGSRLVRDLLGRILRPVATLIGLIAGLSFIGVQTTTLLAGLGVAGLVVGFALQDSISNLFAGIAILASRPYDVDDIVEAGGVVGKVRAMGLWNTTIVTFDARRLLVPNKNIWGSNVENRSAEVNRRVEAVARVGYDSDLSRTLAVLQNLMEEDDRVLADPRPSVWVSRLAESWVEVKLWPWVKTADWWSMHSDLPRLVRLRLAEEGIDVPVPRRDVTTRAARPPEVSAQTGSVDTA